MWHLADHLNDIPGDSGYHPRHQTPVRGAYARGGGGPCRSNTTENRHVHCVMIHTGNDHFGISVWGHLKKRKFTYAKASLELEVSQLPGGLPETGAGWLVKQRALADDKIARLGVTTEFGV